MRTNQISKFFVCTLLSVWSFYSYGQNQNIEFTLKCKVKVNFSDSFGDKKFNFEEIFVEVTDLSKPRLRSIFIKSSNDSINNVSVSVPPPPSKNGYEIKSNDYSDGNKYEITSEAITPNNANISSTIYLNRNNGEIILNHQFKNEKGFSQTSVNGSCEKVDKTKKKF